jgi:hypothetical protein
MEGIDEVDGTTTIDGIVVNTFQNSIHINDEDNRITGTSYLVDESGTEGVYDGYYIALDFNSVTSDLSDVSAIYAQVNVHDEPTYFGEVDENNQLLIQVAASDDVNLNYAVLVITAVDESGEEVVEVYKNIYELFGIQIVSPEPPVEEPTITLGAPTDYTVSLVDVVDTPDHATLADVESNIAVDDETDMEITGTLNKITIGGDEGYYLFVRRITTGDFDSVSAEVKYDNEDVSVDLTYATDDLYYIPIDSDKFSLADRILLTVSILDDQSEVLDSVELSIKNLVLDTE